MFLCYNVNGINMNYFLVGTEVYNLQKRRAKIVKELVDDELNLSVYSGKNYSIQDVVSDCLTSPFFAENKVVIVENPDFLYSNKDDENALAIKDYLSNPNPTTTLIIYCDQAIDRTKAIVKELMKIVKYESFDSLNNEDFRHYVLKDLNDQKIVLDNSAKNELIERLPVDITNWKHELEKLSLYPGKIDADVIRQLVCRPIEEDVFQLSNAVTSKNLSKSIQIYRDLLVNNKNDIKALIGLLAYQFRFMFQMKSLSEQGMSISDISQSYGYNEYRIKITLRNCHSFSSEYLLSLLNKLSTLDQDIINGKVEGKLGLELFIMEACI